MNTFNNLTVVICTYNRAEFLDECLFSLERQTIKSYEFKVLVVDNNSIDNTKEVCNNHKGRLLLEYVFEEKQGLSHARNRGLKETKSKWIAFLDDDAKARNNWLEEIIKTISIGRFDAFGGIYLPWYKDGKEHWYIDNYASNKAWLPFNGIVEIGDGYYCSGGNFIFKRDLFDVVGGFDPHLGMNGGEVKYGEEGEFQSRLRQSGFTIGFNSGIIIDHYTPMAKQNLSWFKRKFFGEGQVFLILNNHSINWFNKLGYSLKFTLSMIINIIRFGIRLLIIKNYYKENFFIDSIGRYYFIKGLLR